jgi:hypothetical protein
MKELMKEVITVVWIEERSEERKGMKEKKA